MKLRTKKVEEKVVIETPEGEVIFYGSPLTPKETSKLLSGCIKKSWERGQRFEEPDLYQFKVKKLQAVINRWKNVDDMDGNPMECTDDNKELVYLFNSKLIDDALEKFDALSESYQKEQEFLEKN